MSASDWMKMRTNLWDDPRVGRIADETDSGEAAVIGALYWLWATADEHSTDGLLPDMTLRQIDRKTGVKGFSEALASVGWIEQADDGVRIVRFEEHNGRSAKRRASESVRKVSARNADKVRTNGGQPAHLEVEEEEELEEEQKQKQARKRATSPPRPVDVDESTWVDWLTLRKAKRAPVTETVVKQARAEADKAGLPLTRFLEIWCARGSQGLQADWLKPNELAQARAGPGVAQAVGKQMQGVMSLEAMKRERLARSGNPGGAATAGLLVAGPDSGG